MGFGELEFAYVVEPVINGMKGEEYITVTSQHISTDCSHSCCDSDAEDISEARPVQFATRLESSFVEDEVPEITNLSESHHDRESPVDNLLDRDVGEDKPDKAGTCFPSNKVYRGVCSNHICDMNVGDDVLITGPTGAEMLLPEDQDANIIMLATGTGIAPMRSYMRLLFNDKVGAAPDGSRKFKGLAWLFMGVPYSNSLLYDDEHKEYASKYPEQFRYDYAISREQKNAAGQKMYIQTKMAEYTEDLWELMQKSNTHVYMCGLKGMEAGMEECFSDIASKSGLEWKEFAKQMKKAGRYHVEVY